MRSRTSDVSKNGRRQKPTEKRSGDEKNRRRMEEQRAQRSEDLMRTLVATLAKREPRRPRTEFGIDSPKLTKLTLSDDIEFTEPESRAVEVRICRDEVYSNEATLLEQVQLYVQ